MIRWGLIVTVTVTCDNCECQSFRMERRLYKTACKLTGQLVSASLIILLQTAFYMPTRYPARERVGSGQRREDMTSRRSDNLDALITFQG